MPGYLRSEFTPGHPRYGALVRCPDCHDGNLSARLAGASQLTGWLQSASFTGYRRCPGNQAGYAAAVEMAGKRSSWLTLWGPFGVGKTHLLAAVVNACTSHRVAAVYYTLPDLLDKMRDGYNDDSFDNLFARLVRLPVLALDELDKVRITEWAREKLYQLFDARYRDLDQRATLFATNVKPDPADAEMGYLYSRMSDYRSQIVEMNSGDVRPVEFS